MKEALLVLALVFALVIVCVLRFFIKTDRKIYTKTLNDEFEREKEREIK